MKILYYFILFALFLSCNDNKKVKNFSNEMYEDTLSHLPVIDLQHKYSQKIITLQDVADVEYIVLESHNDALISAPYTVVTDSMIITYSPLEDNVIFFQRDGKFSHSFNRKGQSGEEYTMVSDMRVNIATKEIYINDNRKGCVQVYTYNGEYIRTLKIRKGSGNGYMIA